MRSVWGIHMPKTVGDAPVRDGYACIGWPTMGDIFAIPNDRDAYKTKLREAYPDKKLGAIPVEAGTVFRFAQEVAVGDVMVFPSKHDRLVNIGEVTGKSWHDPGNEHVGEDYPNFLGVD
ncbi:MAG: restriction endonuclease, partial [Pseudomonadota bacterium]